MKKRLTASESIGRLQEALEITSDNELADMLGITRQAVSIARKREKVPAEWAVRVSEISDASVDSLVFDMPSADSDYARVPLVAASLSAGGGSLETSAEVIGEYVFRKEWLRAKGKEKDMVLMKVSGDSMEPTLFDKDLVLIDQGKTSIYPGSIYALRIEEGIFVKQLEQRPGKRLLVRSLNPKYDPFEIVLDGDIADSVSIIGKAVWWCHEA